MRLLPSDPDVATIVARIKGLDINLQPEFQRGEVWSTAKKQKLIDSILRDWHVPPIHVIELKDGGQQEVLDGQQRLVAIRDFVDGQFTVNGFAEPLSDEIKNLHGLTYSQLPSEWRRRFDRFTIRIFRITDYEPSEPGELFYRLNQPSSLTAAEQRNAFFGPARQQVKDLVAVMEDAGVGKDFLGFSNSRMAFDDVLARLCCSLEVGTLLEKITSTAMASRYRSDTPFSLQVIRDAKSSILALGQAKPFIGSTVRFNKATLFSWLWFIVEAQKPSTTWPSHDLLGHFISYFEQRRAMKHEPSDWTISNEIPVPTKLIDQLVYVYNDRSSARVADVTSVLYRAIITWALLTNYLIIKGLDSSNEDERVKVIGNIFLVCVKQRITSPESFFGMAMSAFHWGEL